MSEQERAARWIRVSSDEQSEASQIPDIDAHIAARGYEAGPTYQLHDKSAYHGEQQAALSGMLADLRAGAFTVLVIWHSDRLERREGKALLDVLAEVREAGGRVESVKEPMLGQLDFGGQVTTFITGLVNHEKSRHIAEQVGLARQRIAANGAVDNRVPWGFAVTGPRYRRAMVPTPQAREYVPQIYRRVIQGESLAQVCRWLEAEGVRPAGIAKDRDDGRGRSGKWWPRSVAKLIRNPVYAGTRVNGAGQTTLTWTTDDEPPLVDWDTWARACRRLDARPKRGPVLQAEPLRAVRRGPVRSSCGGPLYRVYCGRAASRTAYLRCSRDRPGP